MIAIRGAVFARTIMFELPMVAANISGKKTHRYIPEKDYHMYHANSKVLGALVFGATGFLVGLSAALASDDLKPYPAAEAGHRRMVIRLPVVDHPELLTVELIFGKMISVDCNRHMLSGRLSSEIAKGWGYSYFVLGEVKGPASTMMACPPDKPKQNAFVRISLDAMDAQSQWQRYNSKLPIVVYVPDGVEVRYRIWSAEEQAQSAQVE